MTPPSAPLSTPALLDLAAQRFGPATAIEDGPVELSWTTLRSKAHQAARALIGAGITPGDRVAIWAPNMWEWVVAALGIHCAGAVLVPINTRYKALEAQFILDKSQAKLLITVDGFLGLDFKQMLGRPDLKTVVFRKDWDDFVRGAPEAELPAVAPEHLSDILFTSGTTGAPKGVMTTHAQTARVFTDWSKVVGLTQSDRYLVVAPFFHCFGYKAGWLACLITGATILPQPVFDASAVLARISTDQVSVLPGPPALYQTILSKDWQSADLSSLRLAVTGASTIPVQLIHDMRDKLGFATVITGYGLTEATGVATMCRHDDDPETIATTSGRPLPGVEVRLVDQAGDEVPRGEPGHVLVRGYNVMKGYLDDPEQTAAAVVDGWLHTGDIGIMNAQGYIRITDRLKDMFIVGGFNAYPAEIEHLLLDHPAVREVAVVGIPDSRLGEVGVAFIVCKEGAQAAEADIIQWCRERFANFKVPRRVSFVDALPRNASAKVLKFALRAQALEGTQQA
jgi:acyl-CoA synthetase (AMP-forming)/AMP-acid ligase II